jgi:UDP-N-acetyl-D-mannosaminuronic acid dehydrogenase
MKNVAIIGGLGHIGLTLAAVMHDFYNIVLIDINREAVVKFNLKKEPSFYEPFLDDILKESVNIEATTDISRIVSCEYIVITIGTPVDEYLNPKISPLFKLFESMKEYFTNQTIILRSTIHPGITKKIEKKYSTVNIAFCPERIAGGRMIEELYKLPQIISGNNDKAIDSACEFFKPLGINLIILNNTTSGELAKLMTNAYRYIHFAISNQFFMLAQEAGCNFYDIYNAMTEEYPRMESFPKPFWTSGYCLRKDTIQLAAWKSTNTFSLGYDASIINEMLPLFVFRKIREKYSNIQDLTIGLLGMAFKAGVDDTRDSLAFRMKKILENEIKEVLCHDPYIKNDNFIDVNTLIHKSDLIILMCNHKQYEKLKIDKPVIDLLNFYGNGIGL